MVGVGAGKWQSLVNQHVNVIHRGKNAVARARNRIGVRMSGQPILCKLQENGMSQRSGQLPQPIEVG